MTAERYAPESLRMRPLSSTPLDIRGMGEAAYSLPLWQQYEMRDLIAPAVVDRDSLAYWSDTGRTYAVDELRRRRTRAGFLALIEGAGTQLNAGDTDETISLSSTGAYSFSVESGSAAIAAGTATGTGFGTATPGSPVTLDITATGTVQLTASTGVNIQLEQHPYPTSWIPGPGTARAADVVTSPVSMRDTGTLLFPVWDSPWVDGTGSGASHRLIQDADAGATFFYNTAMWLNSSLLVCRLGDGTLAGSTNVSFAPSDGLFAQPRILGMAWEYPGDLVAYLDGTEVARNPVVARPDLISTAQIGYGVDANIGAFAKDQRLTNSQIAAISDDLLARLPA